MARQIQLNFIKIPALSFLKISAIQEVDYLFKKLVLSCGAQIDTSGLRIGTKLSIILRIMWIHTTPFNTVSNQKFYLMNFYLFNYRFLRGIYLLAFLKKILKLNVLILSQINPYIKRD